MTTGQRVSGGDDARRRRVLDALGIARWVRREPSRLPREAADVPAADGRVACVVILPAGATTRELDLIGRALTACGATLARAARLTARDGRLAGDSVPDAHAYLAFGEAQAQALGRVMSADVLHRAEIVLADDPAQVLLRADAKQRLWHALRRVRTALAKSGR